MAWGAVGGPEPVVEPVETVVGDAAAGLAVVFVVDEPAAVVDELGAVVVAVVASGAVVDVDAVVGPRGGLPGLPSAGGGGQCQGHGQSECSHDGRAYRGPPAAPRTPGRAGRRLGA